MRLRYFRGCCPGFKQHQSPSSKTAIAKWTVTVKECGSGNTGGTGNHTEIWVAILIKTELSEQEIEEFYNRDVQKVDKENQKTFVMNTDQNFSSLQGISDYTGYYIVEYIGVPVFSFFDLRGH